MSEMVTMWSVREAVTKGKIVEVRGTIERGWFKPEGKRWTTWTIGTEVVRTREEAEVTARALVAKRLTSLERTLARTRKNPFATPATSA